jgi:hypothetical protein
MAVYIVTGKLGSGKTLLACMKIQEYLKRGCPVVVNFNLNLVRNGFCKPTNDYSRVIRIPDLPTEQDLVSLGFGNEKYDEEKFGGVFLDEAGIWLNSRNWAGAGRTDILKFFLYIRKRRWDLWLIVQNIDIVDKQIRAAVAEHVVYCSRSDRFQMPFFPKVILNVVTVGLINFVKIPKFHSAVCKYGASHLAPVAHHWYYRGEDYYNVYDTTQEFNSSYDSGSYSILPPFYTLRTKAYHLAIFREYWQTLPSINPPVCTNNKIMRLTKIYFKKVKFFAAFGSGIFFALSVCFLLYVFVLKPANNLIPSSQSSSVSSLSALSDYEKILRESKVDSINYLPKTGYLVYFLSKDKIISSYDLASKGFVIISGKKNEVSIKSPTGSIFVVTR